MKNGNRTWIALFLILGIIDSFYLTVVHFLPKALDCPTIGGIVNCETVLSSSFATVFGIPLAVLGLVWFIVALGIFFAKPHRVIRNIWLILGVAGIVYSITAQALIGKICIYCSFLDLLIALSVFSFIYFKQ
jgi:uncharacterized membrane protein